MNAKDKIFLYAQGNNVVAWCYQCRNVVNRFDGLNTIGNIIGNIGHTCKGKPNNEVNSLRTNTIPS